MKQSFIVFFGALAVAGCNATTPAERGVGFGDYASYQMQRTEREAALSRSPTPGGMPISQEAVARPPAAPAISAAPIQTAGAEPVIEPATGAAGVSNPGISDEQSFQAVSSRETIESDAARIERNASVYQQAAVEPLPERESDTGPNIVEYALSTTNAVGQPLYDRGRVSAERHERNCAKYPSSDKAQAEFLSAGGPESDRMGLDPDGDGFACAWDPTPFRTVRR